MKTVIFSLLMLYSSSALCDGGHRHHDAHQHGMGEIGIVYEGKELSIVLRAPASDLVGFEHAAQSKEEKEAVSNLEDVLRRSQKLFVLPAQAGCAQVSHTAEHALRKAKDKARHSHDSHHSSSHSEVSAEYRFSCQNSKKLDSIQIQLFREFPSLKKIKASIVTPSYQGKQQLSSSSSIIKLQ